MHAISRLEAKIAAREEKLGIRPRRQALVQDNEQIPSASETKSNILQKRIEARKFAIEESRAQVLQKFGPRQKLVSKEPKLGYQRRPEHLIRRPLPALDPNVNPFAKKKPAKAGGLSSVEKNISDDISRLKRESEEKLHAKKAHRQQHRDEVAARAAGNNRQHLAPIREANSKIEKKQGRDAVTLGPQNRMPGVREMVAEAEGKGLATKGKKGRKGNKINGKKGDTPEEDSDEEDSFDFRLAKATGEAPRYRGTWHCLSLTDNVALTPVMQRSEFSRQLKATAVMEAELVDTKPVSREAIVEGAVDKYSRRTEKAREKRLRQKGREQRRKEKAESSEEASEDPRGLWDADGYKKVVGREGGEGESGPDVLVQVGQSAYNVEPAVQHQRNIASRLAMPKSQEQLEGVSAGGSKVAAGGRREGRKANTTARNEKHTSMLTKEEVEAEKKYQRKRRLSHLSERTDRQRRQLEDLMGKHGLQC
jgi:hypothetical protein